jgi:hypothetical protein
MNPYNLCVANKDMEEEQQFIVMWQLGALKMCQGSEEVMDREIGWLQSIYGPLMGSKGSQHTHLGMDFDFGDKWLKILMTSYLQDVIDEFPERLEPTASTPAAVHFFQEKTQPTQLNQNWTKTFQHKVTRTLWAALRAQPNLLNDNLNFTKAHFS